MVHLAIAGDYRKAHQGSPTAKIRPRALVKYKTANCSGTALSRLARTASTTAETHAFGGTIWPVRLRCCTRALESAGTCSVTCRMAHEYRVLPGSEMPRSLGPADSPTRRLVCVHRLAFRASRGFGPENSGLPVGLSRVATLAENRLSFLKRPDYTHFQEVAAGLRKWCPTAFPVIIRTGKVSGNADGLTKRNRNRFVIHLDRYLNEKSAVEVLIHEWAHCMAWSLMHDKASDEFNAGRLAWAEFERATHDASFGVAYAQAWAVYSSEILSLSR